MPDSADPSAAPAKVASLPYAARAPQPGLLSRAGGGTRAWARTHLSREQLGAALRSLLWVGPLTVLIWVYAEREQAATAPNVRVGLDVTSTDPGTVVTLAPGVEPWVTLTLTGPHARLDAARERVEYNGNNAPLRIDVNPKLGTGRRRVPVMRVADDPRFVTSGITVSSPSPDWIDVIIDPVVEREVPVVADPKFAPLRPPTFEPATVRVRGPEQVLTDARARGELVAYAALSDRPEVIGPPPDQSSVTVRDVRLSVPVKNQNIALVGQPSVTATVELARPEEHKFNSVPVFVTAPHGLLDEFTVRYDETVTNVTVVGPKDKIDLLNPNLPNPPTPKAVFEIPPELKEGTHTTPLKYDFGDLNGALTVKDGAARIEFTLTRRQGL